jgi:hypothetical protein
MTTCYIVEGSCGRYEDEQSWVVMVFLHLVVAQHWCDRLNQWCTDHGLAVSPKDDVPYERWNPLPHNPLDPGFQSDHTGTEYCVYSAQLNSRSEP